MGPEELAQISQTFVDAVRPIVEGAAETSQAAAEAAWSFGEAQFEQVMTLGTSLLIAQVFVLVFLLVTAGVLLGWVLVHGWRV